MALPEQYSFEQGAAIPEAFLTAYQNIFMIGEMSDGKSILVHAGARCYDIHLYTFADM
jgi:NADPH:quinone reductase-like Zn-dependent oxidoreductase